MKKEKTSKFSGSVGYVMAVAGSAVGLGNIWRFPYLAAKYGGGTFLITYLVLALTVGFTLLISETALGRKTGNSPIKAFKKLGAKKLKIGGYINSVIPFLIVPYYCVVGGWVLKYLFDYLNGQGGLMKSNGYFTSYISSNYAPALFLVLFVLIVFLVVMRGVEDGVEKCSKVLMPLLIIMALVISIYSIFTPGAMEGLKYYLTFNVKDFSIMTIVAAVGQMFYSLSIGMGILYTYGSYMRKDVGMEKAIGQIEIMDTAVAFLAGMMIIPAVFAFSGGNTGDLQAGASLMFITMPKVFASMQLGGIIGIIFFLLVAFAALTSAISLMECCVATLKEQFNLSRTKGSIIIFLIVCLIGIPVALGYGVLDFIKPLGMDLLDFFDFLSNSLLMPIASLSTVTLILFVTKPKTVIEEVEANHEKFKRKKIYLFSLKYVVSPVLIVIFLSSVLSALGIISI